VLDKARKIVALNKEIAGAQAECNALNLELGKLRRQKAEIDGEVAAIKKRFA